MTKRRKSTDGLDDIVIGLRNSLSGGRLVDLGVAVNLFSTHRRLFLRRVLASTVARTKPERHFHLAPTIVSDAELGLQKSVSAVRPVLLVVRGEINETPLLSVLAGPEGDLRNVRCHFRWRPPIYRGNQLLGNYSATVLTYMDCNAEHGSRR